MKTICIVCARGGSKGLPNKNLSLLGGNPLIARPIMQAKSNKEIDTVLLSTDSDEIAEVGRNYGAEVPFMRPEDLSGDLSTTEATLRHALLTYEALTKINFQLCVFLTCTDIFRNPDWISEAIKIMKRDPSIESVFSGHRTHKNFWKRSSDGRWVRLEDWMATYSSRQIRQHIVREDTGLCCVSRAALWRAGRRIGDRVHIIENDDSFTGIDIHSWEDLMLAEYALKIRSEKHLRE